jgi:predicted RNA-binding protein YlxR (DUF448 family)
MLATAQDNELDRGTRDGVPGAERSCALTREVMSVDSMVRFVVAPDGAVVPDVKRKLPGRGLWITGTRAAIGEAVARQVFARGFKREVKVAADLPAATERLLEAAALDALAMAGKAGRVLTGAAKVEAAAARDDLKTVIHAADAAGDGRRKLDAALRRQTHEKSREIAVIDTFAGGQLDLALNRPNVVHAALLAGPVSETFIARVERLQRFRAGNQAQKRPSANAPTDGARGIRTE